MSQSGSEIDQNVAAWCPPIHAESVWRNLLARLTPEQIDCIVRVSNLLGEED